MLVLTSAAAGSADAPLSTVAVSAMTERMPGGPFQFSETRWLAALNQCAEQVPGVPEAARVFRTSNGKYYIPVAHERRSILDLRHEPTAAHAIALCVTSHNAATLSAALQRAVSAGELYAAHTLGADSALTLIEAHRTRPKSRLDADLRDALAVSIEVAPKTVQTVAALHRALVAAGDDASEAATREASGLDLIKGPIIESVLTVGRPLGEAITARQQTAEVVQRGGD